MSKFRIQNKRLHLTYSTHISKDDYKVWIDGKKKPLLNVYMAHETSDENHPYPHTHILLEYKDLVQTTNVRYFDYDGIHPNITKVVTSDHWINSLKYLAKEDPDNAYMLELPGVSSLVSLVLTCESEYQAVERYVKKPSDYHGVRDMYRDHKVTEPLNKIHFDDSQLRPWEIAFLKINDQDDNDRTINWVYDKKGNAGKSTWGAHMADTFTGDWIVLDAVGSVSDFAQNIKVAKVAGWTGVGLILDLSRSYSIDSGVYSSLESVCNGRVTSTKYSGGVVDVGNPIVWVFSNVLPKINEMSEDRWRILEVLGRKGKGVALRSWSDRDGLDNRIKINKGHIPHTFIAVYDTSSDCSDGWGCEVEIVSHQ